MSTSLKIYHHLPYPLRILAASARGYSLRSWRYGPETDREIEAALERDQWSQAEWKAWQEQRLAEVLKRAATQVPYYRSQWEARRRNKDRASWEYLENWPILEKEPLRLHAESFVSDDCDIRRMYADSTSGTTGKPVRIWMSRATVRKWYAIWEARVRCWHGVSRNDRWAMLGGQLIVPFSQTRPPFWVWNAALNQLYLSAYHIRPDYVRAYLEAMRQHRVEYMLGYASSIHALAQIALDKGMDTQGMKVVINNGDPLYPYRRRTISDVFNCSMRDTYGMVEIVAAASECPQGSLHYWPDAGFLEVLEDDRDVPARPGEPGRFICTGLLNEDMPLIRYQVGDRGSIAPAEDKCSCGRHLPLLKNLDGRHDDIILTRDGRRVSCADTVFRSDLPVHEAQIVQESLDLIRLRYIPAAGFSHDYGEELVKGLHERLGDVRVVLEPVDSIPRSANGKSRTIVSMLPEAQSEKQS